MHRCTDAQMHRCILCNILFTPFDLKICALTNFAYKLNLAVRYFPFKKELLVQIQQFIKNSKMNLHIFFKRELEILLSQALFAFYTIFFILIGNISLNFIMFLILIFVDISSFIFNNLLFVGIIKNIEVEYRNRG